MSIKLNSFRSKLLLMFAFIIIVPLVALSYLISNEATRGIEAQTDAGMKAVVESMERETLGHLEISKSIVESLADNPVMATSNFAGQRTAFAQVIKKNPQFMFLYTGYNNQKDLLSIIPYSKMPDGFDARQRPWYKKAIDSDKVEITDVYTDSATGLPIISIVKSIKDPAGNKVGVLGADVTLDSLSKMVSAIKMGQDGYGYIIDSKGMTIAHPDKELVKKQTNLTAQLTFMKKALAGEQGFEHYVYKGIKKVVAYKKVDQLGWGIFVQQTEDEGLAQIARIKNTILWTTIITIVLAMIVGTFFSNNVAKRVRAMAALAKKVSGGDLTGKVEIKGSDELGQLGASLNEMVANMRNVVSEVARTSGSVNASSQELTAHAEEAAATTDEIANAITRTIEVVEEGARKQGSSVDIAQAAMSELSQAVGQIASGAQEQAANVSRGAEMVGRMAKGVEEINQRMQIVEEGARLNMTKAEEGGQVVAETVQGMEEIKQVVFAAASDIKELGEHSKQIGEIIQVIDDIAEQTNLLALNAAIEAARAGEHGKGFAVVADEVRKLAERSSVSTKEISQLIQTIQRATNQAVKAMDQGTQEVEKGSGKAHAAGKALQEIVAVAKESGEEIKTITASMLEIQEQSRQVVQAIDNVAAITEENTAATEEMAAGSDNVLHTIENIAQANTDSANAVKGVSNSSGELKNIARQVAESAQSLAGLASNLQGVVNKFNI